MWNFTGSFLSWLFNKKYKQCIVFDKTTIRHTCCFFCFKNPSKITRPNKIICHWSLVAWPVLKKTSPCIWFTSTTLLTLLFFKVLLWIYLAKFNKTYQEASLHDTVQLNNKALLFICNKSNKMPDFLLFLQRELYSILFV